MKYTEAGLQRMEHDCHHHDRPHMSSEQLARFCLLCGAPLTERYLEEERQTRKVCSHCGFIFYLNPKTAAGVIPRDPRDGDKIWLLRRNVAPAIGRWTFPGGYVDLGENVRDAAIREALEETCLTVRLDGLLNVYSYTNTGVVMIVYHGTVTGGTAALTVESQEIRAFRLQDIPWDELAFTSTRDALRDYLDAQAITAAGQAGRQS